MKGWILTLLLLPSVLALPVLAEQPEGWAYQLFVDRELWQKHRIQLAPRLQLGLLADSEAEGLATDEGLLLNRAELLVYRPLKGRVLPGEGAKAGPMRTSWDWGFRVEGRYGHDFNPLYGVDDELRSRLKLSAPQWYLDAYAPLLDGVTLRLGNFDSPVGNEGDNPRDPANSFYNRSFAYEYGPKRHVGALFSARLPLPESSGLWSLDAGLVQGWDNLQDNNDSLSLITALHWQRTDKRLTLDLESIVGDEQSEPGEPLQTPFPVRSGDGARRSFQSLTLRYWNDDKRWRTDLNLIHGRQQGGESGAGLISESSRWYGGNVALLHWLEPKALQAGMRYEWLRDENGAHSELPGGIVNSWSANLSWFPEAWLRIRPELRYDDYRQAPGQPNQDNRWLLSIDATLFL